MTNQKLTSGLLALLIAILLSACGSSVNEEELEDALATFYADGDVSDLNDLTCDKNKFRENDSRGASVQVNDIDCSIDDKDVECKVTATVENETLEVIFSADIDGDGKICNFTFSEPDFSAPE